MFRIEDGREYFYQWDIDRRLIIEDNSIKQVHFCNRTNDNSLVCEVYIEDNKHIVNVPNILLQDTWIINVYGYDSNYTKHSEQFRVKGRSKPADYIYTETEVFNYEQIREQLDDFIEKPKDTIPAEGGFLMTHADGSIYYGIYSCNHEGGLLSSNKTLTFTGAVDATYNGEKEVTVNIPDVSEYQTEAQVIALINQYGGSGESLPASEEGEF